MGAPPPFDPSTVFRRTKDIAFTPFDHERLAIDAPAGYCYSLNETAGRVWELMAAPVSFGAICAQLRKEFSVDEQTCVRQVSDLLRGLCDAGLVQVGDEDKR